MPRSSTNFAVVLVFIAALSARGCASSPAHSKGHKASSVSRTLVLTVDSSRACYAVKAADATRAVARDLQALVAPLSAGSKVSSGRASPGCRPRADGGSTWTFLATVSSPKSVADPSGSAVLPATAIINTDLVEALPATAEVLDATGGGRAAWRVSHFIRAAPQSGVLGAPVRFASFLLGPAALPYSATIDTGSPLLAAPCNTLAKIKLCNGSDPNALNVDESNAITTEDACSAAGIGCWKDDQCWFSQALTGGDGKFNSPAGIFVRDQWAIANVAGQGSAPLSIPYGFIACKERYMYAKGNDDKDKATACPPPLEDVGDMKSQCIGAASSDAGWNFAPAGRASRAKKVPSAVAIPQQALDAGLFENPVLSFCWPPSPQIANCAAKDAANNYAVFGPALPKGVKAKDLVEVPLIYNPKAADDSSQPATDHFLSTVTEARVPTFGGGQKIVQIEDADNTMLWDTGAGGSAMVPTNVLKPYVDFYDAAKSSVRSALEAWFNGGGKLEFAIDNSTAVSSVCGGNYATEESGGTSVPARWTMTRFTLPASASKADIKFVREKLSSLFPKAVNIVIGGVAVPLPGSLLVNECDSSGPEGTKSVTVCSLYRPGGRFWWAVPWFQGRFVQFDVSPAVQTADRYGVMRFSPDAVQCKF